jgi:hypothetical protein
MMVVTFLDGLLYGGGLDLLFDGSLSMVAGM